MGAHRVACMVCGDDTFKITAMTPMGGGYVCPGDAKGFTQEMLDAQPPRQLIPPIKSRPAEQTREANVIPLYQEAEARIFNLLTADHGGGILPERFVNVTNGDGAVLGIQTGGYYEFIAANLGIAGIYLFSVIEEDRRPKTWIELAKVKLRWIADTLLSWQGGSPTQLANCKTQLGNQSTGPTDTEYGAITYPADNFAVPFTWDTDASGNPFFYAHDVYMGGLALLRAWQVFGEESYRLGYRMAMTCLRRMQCGGKFATGRWFVNRGTSHSARYHPGMWAWKCSRSSGALPWQIQTPLYVRDLWGLEFLKAAYDEEGDQAYGDSTAVGQFAEATAATLSEMIDEVKTFWTGGAYDHHSKTTQVGFAPVYMSDAYYPTSTTGSVFTQASFFGGTSGPGLSVFPDEWAEALRGWHAAFGFDSHAEALYDFFMATPSSMSQAEFDEEYPHEQWRLYLDPENPTSDNYENVGVYDAALCWCSSVGVRTTNSGNITINRTGSSSNPTNIWYEWSTIGLLAPIHAEQNRAKLTEAKRVVSGFANRWHPGHPNDSQRTAINLMGSSGINLQPGSQVWANQYVLLDGRSAALIGLAYREQPRIFVTRDH